MDNSNLTHFQCTYALTKDTLEYTHCSFNNESFRFICLFGTFCIGCNGRFSYSRRCRKICKYRNNTSLKYAYNPHLRIFVKAFITFCILNNALCLRCICPLLQFYILDLFRRYIFRYDIVYNRTRVGSMGRGFHNLFGNGHRAYFHLGRNPYLFFKFILNFVFYL